MTTTGALATARYLMEPSGLGRLIELLTDSGTEVLAPTVRNGAIQIAPVASLADLPRGWGDSQEPGRYRLVEQPGSASYFGFAVPAGTWKRFLFPPVLTVLNAAPGPGPDPAPGPGGAPDSGDGSEPEPGPRAFLGIRGCDLAAIRVQDRVLLEREHIDTHYAARRADLTLIAVDCSHPARTCFCPSMGTGPAAGEGADLVLTEINPDDGDRHRFVVAAHTVRGEELVAQLGLPAADPGSVAAADQVPEVAASRVTRAMPETGLARLLRESAEHPRWDEVAQRCLSCGSCTMACPTCFCVDFSDEIDAISGSTERVRSWGSCFELNYSYIHGGAVRRTVSSRYRQWLTHKLSSWWDQFDMSGCVGCGRCITWCPVGIDITEEVAALQLAPPGSDGRDEHHESAGQPGGRSQRC